MSDAEILVIGATGHLGGRLVPRLAEAGIRPRVLVRTPENAERLEPIATPFVGDLLDPDSLRPAFEGADRVFVLGRPVPEMEALERNAIDAAVEHGAQRIVYLSNFTATVGSELPPNHIHGVHEELVASLDVEWTVLKPTRYMTNFPFDWASVLRDGVLLESGGHGIMTCIDPEEVAEIATQVLTEDGHERRTYRLTSDDALTAEDLAELLTATFGRDVRAVEGEQPAGYFKLVAEGRYYPTETARELLGRRPRSYPDWLAEHAPALSARYAAG